MNSNLQPTKVSKFNTGYKHIILRKLSCAVTCTVISQLLILIWYIFILNFNIFTPLESLRAYLSIFKSFATWMYILVFSMIVFLQSIVCAKDYIMMPSYSLTRLSRLKATFSVHNLILLNVHIFMGLITVWLFLAFTCYELTKYMNKQFVILENTLYLLYLGAWTGLYYFCSMHTLERRMLFPVIHQLKWLQFKANCLPMMWKSVYAAFWPTFYFIILYALLGQFVNEIIVLEVVHEGCDLNLYWLTWFFPVLINFALRLMDFYFELFLAEPLAFPVDVGGGDAAFLLSQALEAHVPIIQHLASQDAFFLAGVDSHARRQCLFALSSPGNHPHNWDQLVQAILRVLQAYTSSLNNSLSNLLQPCKKPAESAVTPAPAHPQQQQQVFHHQLRQMGVLEAPERINVLTLDANRWRIAKREFVEAWRQRGEKLVRTLRQKLWIDFMLQKLPEAAVRKCLRDGQVIVWLTQAAAGLCASSIDEDRYGVVQKDLPAIASALVELKMSVDKLSRVPALNRRPHPADDFNSKMKNAIQSALRRSIYCLVLKFGPYLNDLNLRHDILVQLQSFALKN